MGFLRAGYRLFVMVGYLAAIAAWTAIGLALYCAPAAIGAYLFAQAGDAKAAAGWFFIALMATGILTIKVAALDKVVRYFHAKIDQLSNGAMAALEKDINSN